MFFIYHNLSFKYHQNNVTVKKKIKVKWPPVECKQAIIGSNPLLFAENYANPSVIIFVHNSICMSLS